FYDMLKDHLYGCLTNLMAEDDEVEITQGQQDKVLILHRVMYSHQTCCINVTTYDMQRSQDSISPSTSHCDIVRATLEAERTSRRASRGEIQRYK
ncbi:hypothetical protein M422DRAFT_182150, partial [Sphaerobolus stellatus SS14]